MGEVVNAESLTKALQGRWNGSSGVARCPGHDDKTPSLSISDGENGRLLVRCHAGCEQDRVIDALKARGLWPEVPRSTSTTRRATKVKPRLATNSAQVPDFRALFNQEPVDFWDYTDEKGRLIRLLGVEVDITERKLYEEALFREKESAQITLRSIGDGVITTDAE